MSFFRSYVAPFLIVLIFAVAMLAVSARIFLPSDMMAPAPLEEPISMGLSAPLAQVAPAAPLEGGLPELSELLHGPGSDRV